MTRVLIIEDDGVVRFDVAQTVAGWGYDVRVASDGLQGFRTIKEWKPDLVLCDINMPHVSGFDIIKRVDDNGVDYSDLVFIFISAMASAKDVVSGISAGADDYITKPIDYDILKAKVESQLRKRLSLAAKFDLDAFSLSIWHAVAVSCSAVAAAGALGVVVIAILYCLKSVLGINIFEDVHFGDFF